MSPTSSHTMSGATMQSNPGTHPSSVPQPVPAGFLASEWAPKTTDRRRRPRVPFDERVRLGPIGQPTRAQLPAENLSAEGIFLKCAQPVKVGALFALELDLPNGEHVFLPEVEVLYNRPAKSGLPSGFGARFVNPPAAASEKLRRATTAFSGTERPKRFEQRGGSAATHESHESLLLYAESRIPDPISDEATRTDPRRIPVELAPSMQLELARLEIAQLEAEARAAERVELSATPGSLRPVDLGSLKPAEVISLRPAEIVRSDLPFLSAKADGAPIDPGEDGAERVTDPELVVELKRLTPDAELEKALFDEPKSLTPTPSVVRSRGPERPSHLEVHAALSRRPGEPSARPSRRPKSSVVEAAPSLISIPALEVPEEVIELPPTRLEELAIAVRCIAWEIGRYLRSHKTGAAITAVLSASIALLATGPSSKIDVAPIEVAPAVVAPAIPTEPVVILKSDVAPPALAPELTTAIEATPKPNEADALGAPKARGEVSLAVAKDAKVIRTLTLSNPPRFVVDIDTRGGEVHQNAASGRVLSVRLGKHDGYTRVVLDVDGPVGSPEVELLDGSIAIRL